MNQTLTQQVLAETARARGQRASVTIDGKASIYWHYPAQKGSATAPSLVMIHGYRGNHHGLEAIAGALPELDIYIPDLPGFGESEEFAGEHNIDNYANWLSEFIKALKLKAKPHLLGHSFGSIVVSCFASRYDQIETLILENPVSAPALEGPRAAATLVAKGFFALAAKLPARLSNGILKSWPMVRGMSVVMAKTRQTALRKWIHQQHDENFNDFASTRVAIEGYTASVANCVSDFSAGFKTPVLMLIGTEDDITSPRQQTALYDSLSVDRCQLVEFESVGHLTHYEIPEQIAQSIIEWIENADD